MRPPLQNKLGFIVVPSTGSFPFSIYEAWVELKLKQMMLARCGRAKGTLGDEARHASELPPTTPSQRLHSVAQRKNFPEKFLTDSA